MFKYTFLVYHKEYTGFLKKIQEKGALHVIEKPQNEDENDELHRRLQYTRQLKDIISALTYSIQKEEADAVLTTRDEQKLIEEANRLFAERDKLISNQQLIEKDVERLQPWGDFDRKIIAELQEAGYEVRFYSCSRQRFQPEWEIAYNATEIDSNGSTIWFITITEGVEFEIEADRLFLPKKNLSTLLEDAKNFKSLYNNKTDEIHAFALRYTLTFEDMLHKAYDEYNFAKVYWNTSKEADEKVMILEGWIPEDAVETMDTFLDKENIYFEKTVPQNGEKVPIKLKNNKFARLFESIGEMYELPNYNEVDMTPFFAPFYMLFFGLCLGDAGYGLLIVIVALIFRPRVKPSLKPTLSLAIVLGIGAFFIGIISGTFFGIALPDVNWSWIQNLKVIILDSNQLFNLAIILGIGQIIFGMFIKAISSTIRFGLAASLRHWGWLILILGAGGSFALENAGIITAKQAHIAMILSGCIAVLFIFILNNFKRNILINVGAGLWDSYNTATGLLGDVLSYIRLFALGVSGAAMGFVFNYLAINLSGNVPVLSQVIMLIILLLGHGLNIFISGLGAFVHPMRLTFVEFYKNAGFEGGGKKYIPFSKSSQ
jgi:V/A-type H+-transporting ATPase subunit I